MDLPIIIAGQMIKESVVNDFFKDWRLYFTLILSGLFNGIGNGFAQAVHDWRKKVNGKFMGGFKKI